MVGIKYKSLADHLQMPISALMSLSTFLVIQDQRAIQAMAPVVLFYGIQLLESSLNLRVGGQK